QGGPRRDRLAGRVGLDAGGGDVRGRDRFEPDGLPDARGARVPDALAAELLALGLVSPLLGIAGIIDGHDHFLRAAGFHGSGDVVGKGRIAAAVRAHLAAVDPDGALPINRTEVEQYPLVFTPFRDLDRPPVPDALVDFLTLADAGECRLERPGDEDFHRQRLARRPAGGAALVVVVEGEFPQAVQVLPFLTHQLG